MPSSPAQPPAQSPNADLSRPDDPSSARTESPTGKEPTRPDAPRRAEEASGTADAPDRRQTARPALAFGATAVAAVLGVALTWLLLVGTTTGQQLENAALRGAEFRSEVERQAALDRLSQVSVTVLALGILTCFVIGQLRKRGWLATAVVVSIAASVVIAELLKSVLGRPPLVDGPAWLLRNSFPSGSAAVATGLALGLYLVAPDRLRWLALTVGVIVAALISEAVQTSGWHRLSDTIGATLLSISGLFGGLWALARAGLAQPSDRGRIDPRLAGGVALAAAIPLLIGLALLGLLVLFPVLTTPVDARRAFLQTAFPLLGTGWTVAAILGATRLVEPYTLGARPASASGPHRMTWRTRT